MSQREHFRATRLDGLACLREGNRIAPVQEQHSVFRGEFLSDCTSDSPASACDQITLHKLAAKLSLAYKDSNLRGPNQSGAKTPRTPKLRETECASVKSSHEVLWSAHASSRRFSNRATRFFAR